VLTRLLSPFREFGWFTGLIYAVDRLLQLLSPSLRLYFYELLVQPIPEEPLLPSRLAKGLEMREIPEGAPEIALMPARPDIKESRFRQNAICLGAYQKNQFIGYIWFCFHAYEEDEVRCTFVLPEGAVFDFDLFLFPGHRLGLGFIGIWNGANEFLRNRKVKCSFSRLTRFNLASRRAHLQLGARCVGRVFVLRLWQVEFMIATVRPFAHISFRKHDRVRLKLRHDACSPATPPVAGGLAHRLEPDLKGRP
jgi:hypothetical protein